jgi:uncharacterized protein
MSRSEILELTQKHIQDLMQGESTGHDWWHIERVRTLALKLAKAYSVNLFVIEMSALLHDIADHKFHNGNTEIGPQRAASFLRSVKVNQTEADQIINIIKEVSFSKGLTPHSLEGKIVQDADRLDAIGAIGIARAFAYGGYKKREIFNPEIPPLDGNLLDRNKKNTHPTINHFYEKLLLLKDMMNTQEAKEMAQKRHNFMNAYLKQFYAEWKGIN